jgi:hypothetical protein
MEKDDVFGLGAAVEKIADLARAAMAPQMLPVGPNGERVMVSGDKQTVTELPPVPPPRGMVRKVEFRELDSFQRYVKTMLEPVIFVNPTVACELCNLMAVPGCDSTTFKLEDAPRAHLSILLTEDWRRWVSASTGGAITHEQLIDLLEDQLDRICEPPAAELMEMMRDITVTQGCKMRRVVDTAGGTRFVSESETKVVASELVLPKQLLVVLRVCDETDPITVVVRIRATVGKEGGLQFVLKMQNVSALMTEAVRAIVARLNEHHDCPIYLGAPVPR